VVLPEPIARISTGPPASIAVFSGPRDFRAEMNCGGAAQDWEVPVWEVPGWEAADCEVPGRASPGCALPD